MPHVRPIAGIYDRVGAAWREPVNAPNAAFSRISLDGVELSALGRKVRWHEQTLSLANALFTRDTVFTAGSKNLTFSSTRFLSATRPNLGVVSLSFSCDKAANITLESGIDANIWDLNGPHLLQLTSTLHDAVLLVEGLTSENARHVSVAEMLSFECAPDESHEVSGNRNLRVLRLRAEAGQTYTFHKYPAVYTEHDRVKGPLGRAAVETVRQASIQGYGACLAEHDAEWSDRWRRCDVEIKSDDEAQHALRYSIFQLLMVAPVKGSANSIPARALSGQVYKGAIFLHTYPEKAVELMR